VNITSDDFERWLKLKEATGDHCTTPDSIERIRAAFRAGATVSYPVKDPECLRRDAADQAKAAKVVDKIGQPLAGYSDTQYHKLRA
jgi:hypothetical protein